MIVDEKEEESCLCAFCTGLVETLNGVSVTFDAGIITGWAQMALLFAGLLEDAEAARGSPIVEDPETRRTYASFWSMAEMWIARMGHTAAAARSETNKDNPGGIYN